ncbi:hypothetical protein DFH09DRAFT_1154477 [Mycena vulgaris]|nr:hypothetical protein DFH09DRAFT_1154477 [Mycena vulgaris]
MAKNIDDKGIHPTLLLADLETTINAKKFMKYEHRMEADALELLTLAIRHPKYKEIGSVTALRIRHRCSGMFLEVMDIDTELFTIASTLFDKYGEIRPWLVDNEYHKGSGVWGRELNDGRLIFVFCVSVDLPYRKQGIGSWALEQLYASEHVEKEDKLICWPSPIPRPPQDQWVSAFDGIVDFFRKAGYRRIGGTSFFAYSQDPDHPSRKKDRLDDFDPDDKFSGHAEVRFALQDAIFEEKSEKIVQLIQNAHARNPMSIHQPDSNGFRPIFIAVKSGNLCALRTLISLGLSAEDFNSRENGDHVTALETCNDDMRCSREFEEIFSREGWRGYSETSLLVKAALKRAMGHPMPGTDDEYVAKKKWGCTCNKCHGGFLSPRTLIRLKDEAEMGYDTASETIDMEQMVPREPLDAQSIEFNPILSYIPKHLWPQVFKTFILGYGSIMKAITQLLSRFILPTDSMIRAELQNGQMDYYEVQAAEFYFKKGGRVEYALDAIMDHAKNSFDLAGSDFDMYEDDETFLKTASCRNDREFDVVRKNMGLDPMQAWGPYSMSPPYIPWTMDSDDSGEEEEEDENSEDGDGNSDVETE